MDEPARDACIAALRALPSQIPNGTDLIALEVHFGNRDSTWDLVAYPMDVNATQVEGVAIFIADGIFVDGASDEYEVSETVASWWQAAGSGELPWGTYVAPHDDRR